MKVTRLRARNRRLAVAAALAPAGTIDASNANTPGEIDPTIADSVAPTTAPWPR